MNAGGARGLDHHAWIGIIHARDILTHRAVEQRHRLGQVADHGAKRGAFPEIDVVTVEEDAARRRLQRADDEARERRLARGRGADRKSTRLNSSHVKISYAVFCLKKKRTKQLIMTS